MMTSFKLTSFAVLGISMVLSLLSGSVSAADKSLSHNKQASIYAVMATITVKPEAFEQFVKETLPLIEKSRAEEGLTIYQLHQSRENPLQFMWYEHFNNKDAFDFHVQTAHVSSWAKIVGDLASVQLVATPFQLIESGADIVAPNK
ncbi:putative quinol monooxygenase [Chromatiaceae bacterium AAb-1]|nr:putative quinol monooxygenase [Chromatiaceae bacterium AAb-1]